MRNRHQFVCYLSALCAAVGAVACGGSSGVSAPDGPIVYDEEFLQGCSDGEQRVGCGGVPVPVGTVLEFPDDGVVVTYVSSSVSVEENGCPPLDTAVRFSAQFEIENTSDRVLTFFALGDYPEIYFVLDEPTGTYYRNSSEDVSMAMPDELAPGESVVTEAKYGVATNAIIGPETWEIELRVRDSTSRRLTVPLAAEDQELQNYKATSDTRPPDPGC